MKAYTVTSFCVFLFYTMNMHAQTMIHYVNFVKNKEFTRNNEIKLNDGQTITHVFGGFLWWDKKNVLTKSNLGRRGIGSSNKFYLNYCKVLLNNEDGSIQSYVLINQAKCDYTKDCSGGVFPVNPDQQISLPSYLGEAGIKGDHGCGPGLYFNVDSNGQAESLLKFKEGDQYYIPVPLAFHGRYFPAKNGEEIKLKAAYYKLNDGDEERILTRIRNSNNNIFTKIDDEDLPVSDNKPVYQNLGGEQVILLNGFTILGQDDIKRIGA